MSWRAGSASSSSRGRGGSRLGAIPKNASSGLARAKIGELMMRLELAEHLIEKRGAHGRVEGAAAMRGLGEPCEGSALSADDDLCRLPRVTFDSLPNDGTGGSRATSRGEARAEDAMERCRRRRGDPRDAGGDLVPRRGLSQDPGASGA